ncbi:hydroxypyruvate isomerase family protein [Aestuariivirga sp.]|uniref:hydroxypyruvate isomerase family protein n=1 Tax=Aestuariivirga sp. TaxID=2650926 RepID=UPI0039E418C0
MRFSANIGFLYSDRPLLDRIRASAEAGFSAVEMHWPYDIPSQEVKATLDACGLPILGVNTPVGSQPGDFGLAAIAGREAEFRESFAMTLAYARAIGASAIHCMAGVADPDAAMPVFLANLDHAAKLAEKENVTLLLEPINQRDKPGYMLRNTAHALRVIRELGHGNVKLMFDCYHVQITEGDVTERFEAALPFIGHVQIAAAPSRQEPDGGELNYEYVLGAMKTLGYEGWIGAEYKPRSRTEDGLAWLARWKDKFDA